MNNETVRKLGEQTLSKLEDPVSPEFAREFVLGTFDQPVPEEFLERVVSQSLKVPARVWREYWEGVVLTTDDTSRLGEIVAPTLILWGEQGASSPAKNKNVVPRRSPTPP